MKKRCSNYLMNTCYGVHSGKHVRHSAKHHRLPNWVVLAGGYHHAHAFLSLLRHQYNSPYNNTESSVHAID